MRLRIVLAITQIVGLIVLFQVVRHLYASRRLRQKPRPIRSGCQFLIY